MKLPVWMDERLAFVGAGAAIVAAWLFWPASTSGQSGTGGGSGVAPVPAAPEGAPPPLHQLTADPIAVVPGRLYRAVVVTHGLVNSATADQIVSFAASKGFMLIDVEGDRPEGFPGTAKGDWYVAAVYAGAPQSFARKNGSFVAGADIVDAWEGE